MKNFNCHCGQKVFFENTHCTQCKYLLGFAPTTLQMHRLELCDTQNPNMVSSPEGKVFRLCKNGVDFDNCNWLIDEDDDNELCRACRLNDIIPNLSKPENLLLWSMLESAKRHLLYSIFSLNLPLESIEESPEQGLAFRFMEDQSSNPLVEEEHVSTGHLDGLITINVSEADHVSREIRRKELNEPYRTLLGHFRHESGHYFWDRMVKDSEHLDEFRKLFGDETTDYARSLNQYYAREDKSGWEDNYISAYCQAHPLEDWAECWAHYLHMYDGLETAGDNGLLGSDNFEKNDFPKRLEQWYELTMQINAMNRSLGMIDPYPFILSNPVSKKLAFIDRLVMAYSEPNQ